MEGGGAYGAGKATGQFDPLVYIKKPQVILRLVSWVFSIIVFGCISSQGWDHGKCLYNNDVNACGFGTAVGVIAFLGLVALLIADALFDNIPSVQQRKYIVIGDMGFSGFWAFMYFVCFCYLTDAWRRTSPGDVSEAAIARYKSGVEAAIAFAFFSIGTFGGLTALAVMRYRSGVSEDFSGPYDQSAAGGGGGGSPGQPQSTPSPYGGYPSTGGETGDPYQQGPFSGQPDPVKQAPQEFSPPTY